MEPLLLGRELRLPKGRARRAVTVKLAMRQLLEALRDCHASGIVHRCGRARQGGRAGRGLQSAAVAGARAAGQRARQRGTVARLALLTRRPPSLHPTPALPPPPIPQRDFKPQNAIVSSTARRLKLIDFGAAADLRLGINYVPNEYLLDPRWVGLEWGFGT
jgi:serine/threonine protein kinase